MNRIPPDRSMPAVLLTDGPDTTATVHAHGWNITATIDTGCAARLAHTMTGSRRALIWHGRGWTISLPLPAPETATGTSARQADATPTGHIPAVIPERPDAPTQQLPVIDPPGHATGGHGTGGAGTRADLLTRWRSITQAATRRKQPGTRQ